MTEQEYVEKRAEYSTSTAPKEIIEEAIRTLDKRWGHQKEAIVIQDEDNEVVLD